MSTDIGVLIVDDSAFMRNMVGKIINGTDGLTVKGKAMNGVFGLEKTKSLQPDVIVLDLEMPEMNGIEFLKERRRLGITVPVIILSSLARKGARITMEAMSLGASDFVLKPSGSNSSELSTVADQLVQLIKAYGARHTKHRLDTPRGAESRGANQDRLVARQRREITKLIDIVVIGISTGGPSALRQVFSDLDPSLPVPIMVVQHMPAGFTYEFAASLDKISPLSVREAQEGDMLKPGRIFIAPGDYHMTAEKRRLANVVHLNQDDPVNGHRPSADMLFSSVAKPFENRILGIIMTGMGRDGAAGIGEIYHAGGITIAQDSASSVVYGMPRVAFENGVIDSVVPLQDIAATINRLVLSSR